MIEELKNAVNRRECRAGRCSLFLGRLDQGLSGNAESTHVNRSKEKAVLYHDAAKQATFVPPSPISHPCTLSPLILAEAGHLGPSLPFRRPTSSIFPLAPSHPLFGRGLFLPVTLSRLLLYTNTTPLRLLPSSIILPLPSSLRGQPGHIVRLVALTSLCPRFLCSPLVLALSSPSTFSLSSRLSPPLLLSSAPIVSQGVCPKWLGPTWQHLL